ncbi:MAG: hypothetical protein WCJ29_01020 [bacterium]
MWNGLGSLLSLNPTKRYVLHGALTALTVEEAAKVFKDIFPKFAEKGKVESITNGLVTIRVSDSISMQEMTLRKPTFARALKERGMAIREIKVQMRFASEQVFENQTDEYSHDT